MPLERDFPNKHVDVNFIQGGREAIVNSLLDPNFFLNLAVVHVSRIHPAENHCQQAF